MIRTNRRQFLEGVGVSIAAVGGLRLPRQTAFAAGPAAALPGDIEKIEHLGLLFDQCTLPGETRADGVVPRHANALQLSRDRWLVVYSTHGYRGVDDERSIVYQIRADAPNGALLKEGFLSQGREDWFPPNFDKNLLGPDHTVYKQHGHMVPFGVPHGAVIDGRPPPHAGLFVVKWRVSGRLLNRKTNYLEHRTAGPNDGRIGQGVEWVQFRLNGTEDDISIVQSARLLRQAGYEQGPTFTSAADVAWMNESFVPAVPHSADAAEWADVNHFDGHRLAAMKYRYHSQRGVYEWVEIGPRIAHEPGQLHEAGLARIGDEWVISARQPEASGVAWFRSKDPFAGVSEPFLPSAPRCNAPLTAFVCADGVLRLFTGDGKASPYRNARDPLYMWDVDVQHGFEGMNPRVIFDSVTTGLKIRREVVPKVDFCELFPHQGRTQLIVHGVSTRGYNFPYINRTDIPAINDVEKAAAGIYYAQITYRHEPKPRWQFA